MEMNRILVTRAGKVNFLKGLIRLARCDEEKADSEKLFYQQAAHALGLDEKDTEEIGVLWDDDNVRIDVFFETDVEKMFFFVQAIQLCWIDGSYTEVEKEEIYMLAQELNITEDAIQQVEAWVKEGLEWNRRGDDLLVLH